MLSCVIDRGRTNMDTRTRAAPSTSVLLRRGIHSYKLYGVMACAPSSSVCGHVRTLSVYNVALGI